MAWQTIPSSPPVAGVTTGHATDHQSIYQAIRELRTESARNAICQAAFTWDGTNATARRNDGTGTVIASGTNASTVLNAACAYVGGLTLGGMVSIYSQAGGSIPVTSPITLPNYVGLFGSGATYTNTSATQIVGDAILVASGAGMTASNAVIESVGVSGAGGTCQGISIFGIGVDGNNQSMCWHTINANAVQIHNCVFVKGEPYCLWFESDIAPNPLPGGSFANVINDCVFHGVSAGGGGVAVLRASGTGATDGHIQQCTMHTATTPVGVDVAGGWEITGNHLTGTTTTTSLVTLNGANSICVGNYLDTAKAGHNIWIMSPKCVVSGNYILNGGASTVGTSCIYVGNDKGIVTSNFLDTTGSGYGISRPNGSPGGGVVAMNHSNGKLGSACYVDSSGNPIASMDDGLNYIAGNTMFSGS